MHQLQMSTDFEIKWNDAELIKVWIDEKYTA